MMEDEGEILVVVTNFYQELFTFHAGNNMDDLLLCVEAKVTSPYRHIMVGLEPPIASGFRPRQ